MNESILFIDGMEIQRVQRNLSDIISSIN